MGYSAGLLDKLMYNDISAGGVLGGTPVLALIDEIEDLKIPDKRNEISGKLRKFDVVGILVGQRELSIEFKLAINPTSTVWQLFQTAYLNKTTIELFAFYLWIDVAGNGQPDAGSKAIRVECQVVEFPIDQPLEDMDSGDVVCKPSLNAVEQPSIYEVT